jgi:hypothetical protein
MGLYIASKMIDRIIDKTVIKVEINKMLERAPDWAI